MLEQNIFYMYVKLHMHTSKGLWIKNTTNRAEKCLFKCPLQYNIKCLSWFIRFNHRKNGVDYNLPIIKHTNFKNINMTIIFKNVVLIYTF